MNKKYQINLVIKEEDPDNDGTVIFNEKLITEPESLETVDLIVSLMYASFYEYMELIHQSQKHGLYLDERERLQEIKELAILIDLTNNIEVAKEVTQC